MSYPTVSAGWRSHVGRGAGGSEAFQRGDPERFLHVVVDEEDGVGELFRYAVDTKLGRGVVVADYLESS